MKQAPSQNGFESYNKLLKNGVGNAYQTGTLSTACTHILRIIPNVILKDTGEIDANGLPVSQVCTEPQYKPDIVFDGDNGLECLTDAFREVDMVNGLGSKGITCITTLKESEAIGGINTSPIAYFIRVMKAATDVEKLAKEGKRMEVPQEWFAICRSPKTFKSGKPNTYKITQLPSVQPTLLFKGLWLQGYPIAQDPNSRFAFKPAIPVVFALSNPSAISDLKQALSRPLDPTYTLHPSNTRLGDLVDPQIGRTLVLEKVPNVFERTVIKWGKERKEKVYFNVTAGDSIPLNPNILYTHNHTWDELLHYMGIAEQIELLMNNYPIPMVNWALRESVFVDYIPAYAKVIGMGEMSTKQPANTMQPQQQQPYPNQAYMPQQQPATPAYQQQQPQQQPYPNQAYMPQQPATPAYQQQQPQQKQQPYPNQAYMPQQPQPSAPQAQQQMPYQHSGMMQYQTPYVNKQAAQLPPQDTSYEESGEEYYDVDPSEIDKAYGPPGIQQPVNTHSPLSAQGQRKIDDVFNSYQQ